MANLFIFYFVFLALEDRAKINLTSQMPKRILLIFFSQGFMVSILAFKLLIYFKFIFYIFWGILLHGAIQFCQHNLLKRILHILLSFVIISWIYMWGFLGGMRGKEPASQYNRHEMWVWFLSWEYPMKKEMATHSRIFSWRIPWAEETGGPQSIGSQRVGHGWSDLACMHAYIYVDLFLDSILFHLFLCLSLFHYHIVWSL